MKQTGICRVLMHDYQIENVKYFSLEKVFIPKPLLLFIYCLLFVYLCISIFKNVFIKNLKMFKLFFVFTKVLVPTAVES